MPPTSDPSRRPTSPASGRTAQVSADPAPLFVYGSLLFPDVVQVLIDRDATRTPATLDGWQVIALPDQPYPTIITADGATATGQLFTDLTVAEWQTLDAFEAPTYALTRVETSAGPAYVYASPANHALTPGEWDVEAFGSEQLPNYLDRCRAWRQRYEAQQ
ncbi:gamma-glutamylcyclotransferase [Kineosporia rhizophila]|uniref:gamma-glutamylcyclotransferase family protein n=1 Tax=Kineosporia TaxID=49184 RepID=UPI001E2EC85C|nr:gamma-glutamylcyclotransferase [Kineosporia rhizophila]GLY19390.1 hypothetical protein Kisp01_64040 [Kineosporia sp. NBRC 101677]